jgi:sirohydrochlorin cobaltochelatase
MSPAPPLLAVAHGTSDPAGEEVLGRLLERVRALRPGLDASLGYLDHSRPSAAEALAALPSGPSVVLPLLLFAATHSKGDIPAAIGRERSARPDARIVYGRPLGPDALLVSALDDRLREAGAGPEHAVVLAAAGASDPQANADIAATARLLWEWRSAGSGRRSENPPVEPAYASASRPTVAEATQRLRRLGYESVALAQAFLAPGHFARASADAVREVAPDAVVADILGAHDDLARLLLSRYDEALGAPVRMNCDGCMFRTPWPGREYRVGEPPRAPAPWHGGR